VVVVEERAVVDVVEEEVPEVVDVVEGTVVVVGLDAAAWLCAAGWWPRSRTSTPITAATATRATPRPMATLVDRRNDWSSAACRPRLTGSAALLPIGPGTGHADAGPVVA
jgi:hypothetical protein